MNIEAGFFNEVGISYLTYRSIIDSQLSKNQTTGPDQSQELVDYTKMNVQRMARLDKTVIVTDGLKKAIEELRCNYDILVISEGWCGDAAQIVPIIQQIAEISNGKFDLKIVFRDEDVTLIDRHLTNGGRAIPIVLVLDRGSEKLVAKWGPRPLILQGLMKEWKKEITDQWEISTMVHTWYAKDKTLTTQLELQELVKNLEVNS